MTERRPGPPRLRCVARHRPLEPDGSIVETEELVSDGRRLVAHVVRPAGSARVPAVLVVPGFPRGTGGATTASNTYLSLVDRLGPEVGWAAMTFWFRGTGSSEGDFSLDGWLVDVHAAIAHLRDRSDVTGIWLAGFRLGGTLSVLAAAADPEVRGLATFSAPASLTTWVRDPAWFHDYCRRVGVLRTEGFPPDRAAWVRTIARCDPVAAAAAIPPRPWLVVHGSDDDVVPLDDARALVDAAPGALLRIVAHGVHRLRHDPRAVAALVGWLSQQGP